MDHAAILATLPPPYRLALAYTPRSAQPATLGLLALDQRLADIVRSAREPLLAQLKLAWWRDRLSSPPAEWPLGEPLLALLAEWGAEAHELTGMVDGWEALLMEAGPAELIAGRGRAAAALARVIGASNQAQTAASAARQWTDVEFGGESANLPELPKLSKELRALVVLIGVQSARGQSRLRQFLWAMRIGLFGR